MTIGFGEKGIQKARDAHGGVSPWVSPGPSIAIPSHGNWELSIPQSLSAPLVSTQHSPPLKGCSCWGPFHSPSQDSASPNTVLPAVATTQKGVWPWDGKSGIILTVS